MAPPLPAHDDYYSGSDAEVFSFPVDVHDKLFLDTPLRSATRVLEGVGRTFTLSKALQRVMLVKEAAPWPKPPNMPRDLEARFFEGIKTMDDEMEQDSDGASFTDVDSHNARSSYHCDDFGSSTTLATTHPSRPQTSDKNKPFLPIASEMMNKTVWPAKSSVDPQHQPSPETELQTSYEMNIGKPSTLLNLIGPGRLPALDLGGSLLPPPGLQFGAAIPDINITAASPSKEPATKSSVFSHSRKRPTTITDLEPPPVFRPRLAANTDGNTTGLPVLPPSAEALWRFHFPGNTSGLLSTILQWSLTMQKMFKGQPRPMLFRLNAAFPHPISLPTCGSTISLGFYDTQRGEVCFLGPGDAQSMFYGELEVFAGEDDEVDAAHKQSHDEQSHGGPIRLSSLNKMKEKLAAHKFIDSRCRADTGEGRWAFVLIKGHPDPSPAPIADSFGGFAQRDTTEPHVMIAYPTSGVTDTSSSLHTIYPDGVTPPTQDTSTDTNKQTRHFPEKKTPMLRRLSSLQTLQSFLSRSPKQIYQSMRSSSTADLPRAAPLMPRLSRPASASASTSASRSASAPVPVLKSTYTGPPASMSASTSTAAAHLTVPNTLPSAPTLQFQSTHTPPIAQGLNLHRTVLKFEQGGFLPLIEGYRVDVGKFRPWIEAVGRGEGKLIVWRDVRNHGVSKMV